MELPKINEIALNIGTGTGTGTDVPMAGKHIISALLVMELISGQKPIITRAKKSIDKFKLREKTPMGCKVTLRNKKMYEFLDRLVNLVFPTLNVEEETRGHCRNFYDSMSQRGTFCSASSSNPRSRGLGTTKVPENGHIRCYAWKACSNRGFKAQSPHAVNFGIKDFFTA